MMAPCSPVPASLHMPKRRFCSLGGWGRLGWHGCSYAPPADVEDAVTDWRQGSTGDRESWTKWVVIPCASLEELTEEAAIEASGYWEFYGGPGRAFRGVPRAKRYGRKFIVVQSGGLDI